MTVAEITPRPLAELTTLRAGAAPARMVDVRTTDELVATLRDIWADREPWLVVGGGSNLLVGDEPFDGTVVVVRTAGIEELPSPVPGHVRLKVQAGHSWDELVEHAVSAGLSGIAAMSGIPGTAGAGAGQCAGQPHPADGSGRTGRGGGGGGLRRAAGARAGLHLPAGSH